MEKWKRIVIQNKETNYEVSNFGRCRNITRLNSKNKGIIKPKINGKTGYCQYSFSINGDKHYRYAHRLVAEYFLPKPKDGQDEVNHKDGNKENNHHTNLEWCSKQENMKHAFSHELVQNTQKQVQVYTLSGEFVGRYVSISEAYRELGLPTTWNSNFDIDKRQSRGFQFRFDSDDDKPIEDITNTCKYYSCGLVQLTMQGEFIKEYETMTLAYAELGVKDNGVISQVCKGRRKSYKGYKWMYSRDYFK